MMRISTIKVIAAWLILSLCGAMAHAGTVTYVYTDAQGTPLAEADANGNITATFDYQPYGAQALGAPPNGPGYTGHVNDVESGLVYMQQRYYDPVIGRFVSVDPVTPYDNGDMRYFNRYTYAFNNPYSFIDPDGRAPGDNWYGYNDKRFQDWVHAEKQAEGRGGARNYTKRDLERLFQEWDSLGKPRGKGGISGRGGSQRGFVLSGLLFKLNVLITITTYSSDLNGSEQEIIDGRMREVEEARGRQNGPESSGGGSTSVKISGDSEIKRASYDSSTGEAKIRLEPKTGSLIPPTVTVCVDKSKCGG